MKDGIAFSRSGSENSFLQGLKPNDQEHVPQGLKSPPPKEGRIETSVALAALRFYKAYLSLLVGGSCRFQPTCSMYAYEAIEQFGVPRGSWLALKRLLRCHPLSRRFGYDPVPEPISSHTPGTPEEARS